MNFINWLTKSSVNPQAMSLTVRGILVGIVPFAVIIAPLLGVPLTQEIADRIVDLVSQIVLNLWTFVAVLMTTYGLLRKLCITTRNLFSK